MNGEERASVIVPADALAALAADAARSGDVETLERALAAGVVVSSTTPRGDPLLMLAAYHDRIDAVRLLLAPGGRAEPAGHVNRARP